jgi:hypothetical protein
MWRHPGPSGPLPADLSAHGVGWVFFGWGLLLALTSVVVARRDRHESGPGRARGGLRGIQLRPVLGWRGGAVAGRLGLEVEAEAVTVGEA